MKNIRFRIYDKEDGMVDIYRIDIGDGTCYKYLISNSKTYDYWNDVCLMQNTGLFDKHGEDIFEKDILRHGSDTGEVLNHKGMYVLINRTSKKIIPLAEIENLDEWEIVGNSYEGIQGEQNVLNEEKSMSKRKVDLMIQAHHLGYELWVGNTHYYILNDSTDLQNTHRFTSLDELEEFLKSKEIDEADENVIEIN